MSIPGLHLTQIGNGASMLEATSSLNIRDQDRLLEGVASRLYYDLSEKALIDPVYYAWLDALARTVRSINVTMVCIHMQPTAAFALAQFIRKKPAFEIALDIFGWQKTGQ